MIDYFGTKVSWTPNDKSERASYRYAKNDCLIFDKSYYRTVQVDGDITLILNSLELSLDLNSYK